QQELHQVLLGRRHERLDDVDVTLPAVRLQLCLEAVVAEPGHLDRRQRDVEVVADGLGTRAVGGTTEDDDAGLGHGHSRSWSGQSGAAYPEIGAAAPRPPPV